MRDNVGGAVWRFLVFAVVCVVAAFGMVAVFGQLRFGAQKSYHAEFSSVSGLESGNFVRIAGVEVGKVQRISIKDNTSAVVEFGTQDDVVLTEGTRAVIRYDNLIGGRYLALEDDAGSVKVLQPGQTIPIERTAPALDLDALIGGFKPLFRALDPAQVNALTGQLIQAFQGEGAAVGSVLAQTAVLTNTLADRDELIGQVITNLNTVLRSLGTQSQQFDKAVTALSELVTGLAARKNAISDSVANVDAAAGSLTDLLVQARTPLHDTVHQADRVASTVLADHDYFDNILNTMPDTYKVLARQGLYGDFFNFYLCEVVLKVNGKGGQPVYVRLANQTTGRCAPK